MAYGEQVREAREAKRQVNLLPERMDMDEDVFKEFMDMPVEMVMETTREELRDYGGNIGQAMDCINEEINEAGGGGSASAEEMHYNTLLKDEVDQPQSTPIKRTRKKKENIIITD